MDLAQLSLRGFDRSVRIPLRNLLLSFQDEHEWCDSNLLLLWLHHIVLFFLLFVQWGCWIFRILCFCEEDLQGHQNGLDVFTNNNNDNTSNNNSSLSRIFIFLKHEDGATIYIHITRFVVLPHDKISLRVTLYGILEEKKTWIS